MNNQGLLWMNPEKEGVLKKRGGKKKNWKIRQFLVKDTFLFYFKVASGGERLPSGVVPLQGSKVDLSPQEEHETEGSEVAPTFVFVIFLPDKLLTEGIVKRNTYFLGGENLTDCYLWIRAIRHASVSRRIVKGQLNHARLELPPMEAMFDKTTVEDPLVLQALSDDLMILYRLVEIAVKLEVFQGDVVGGPGFPSMSEVESMLFTTIEELDKLEDVIPGTEQMPHEDRLVELQLAMVPIQEDYVELLEKATSGEKKHEAVILAVAAEAAADAAEDSSEEDDDVAVTEAESSFRSNLLSGGFS
ncbi:hypothetical protein AXG93_3857s1250 [Marchantia polymorpha subsp. ruderalis]|uniref:PH domain-containing protein n=1 Tax=Marchantia polymorpha subsp. ruderalis TaxID=1480154 RepID=A0A176W3A3_MARPO|nr:hypothetical protein AXG93_3857s1250 [Marchantia polymorpha subsp. ruderalis]